MTCSTRYTPLLLAWGVHGFTATGAVIGLFTLQAVARGELGWAALLSLAALVIDAVDGALARKARVREVLPSFDGRRLDDIVDFLNYTVAPAFFMIDAGSLSHAALAALPVLASAYGFCREDAKTADHFFLGFPSYWNVVAIYLWWYAVPPAWGSSLIVVLSLLVVPRLRFIYPSRMERLRTLSCVLGLLWVLAAAAALSLADSSVAHPLMAASLLYPLYYVAVSAWLGGWFRRDQ